MSRDILGDFKVGYMGAKNLSASRPRASTEPSPIAIVAGRLFRQENITPPETLVIDRDGVICLTTEEGREFGIFIVAGKTFFIDKDGRSLSIASFKTLTAPNRANLSQQFELA